MRSTHKTPLPRGGGSTKYDAHHIVLDKTYGAQADLRRELADSKSAVAERTELLAQFAQCSDSQRAWLILEDYFEKLSLARKDFPATEWWPKLLRVTGHLRLEETAHLFLRCRRPVPPELLPYASPERFAQLEEAEAEQELLAQLEEWILPRGVPHLEPPRATLQILAQLESRPDSSPGLPPGGSVHDLARLKIEIILSRARTGEKVKSVTEITELMARATHEQELFYPADWEVVQWVFEVYGNRPPVDALYLEGAELFTWLTRWGRQGRLLLKADRQPLYFRGGVTEFVPELRQDNGSAFFGYVLQLPGGEKIPVRQAQFIAGPPLVAMVDHELYLVDNPPPANLLVSWVKSPELPVSKLSHRLLIHLSKRGSDNGTNWAGLCHAHKARPEFIFELADDLVRLRLLARSELDQSVWQWGGDEWRRTSPRVGPNGKPELLDDPRLDDAVAWLRQLDWFTPEGGLWLGDANENFLGALGAAWPDRPETAEYLGNPAFQRLFFSRPIRPKLVLHSSGIDWFSVSAAWEQEGLRLTAADLKRLETASGRFVKLPDSGWVELDAEALRQVREAFADFGMDQLPPQARRLSLVQAAQLSEAVLADRFGTEPQFGELRARLANFAAVPQTSLPETVFAEMRPYQKEGFDFLCHLTRLKMGGVLADDMGLGKTLQTLAWLAWLEERNRPKVGPVLVICPASVLHNWRREANRFTPHFKVLLLESGAARHNLRQQIPEHHLILTNYALLRRDLAALRQFAFGAVVLDEAQFIKNPSAQITQSVKQLQAGYRLALTGTPLENRLLDLWSIVDFVEPGYLGSQSQFLKIYENADVANGSRELACRRLSARLRPMLLRRLKRQVAKDLPERIDERRDCELGESQRKLYLAELRRSREQVFKTVADKGLKKSKIHVLAALTRLRQICCHPYLVGSQAASGKTETLFELLEPLLAEGQKVLVFSQFVEMLKLLAEECGKREIPIHVLTGETRQRFEVVQDFQNDPRASVFLLSLRAAGTGLNLTTASYVVLYDPWWNPAVEAQAIDRSHRIGQTRTVNAYRLIAPGTVEEKIWELQQRKAQTISEVLGEEGFAKNLSQADLEYLFAD